MTGKEQSKSEPQRLRWTGAEPATFKTWRWRPQLYLDGLPQCIGPESHGVKLLGVLGSEAGEEIAEVIMNTAEMQEKL